MNWFTDSTDISIALLENELTSLNAGIIIQTYFPEPNYPLGVRTQKIASLFQRQKASLRNISEKLLRLTQGLMRTVSASDSASEMHAKTSEIMVSNNRTPLPRVCQ